MKEVIDLQIDTQGLTNEVGVISDAVTGLHMEKIAAEIARIFGVVDRCASEMRTKTKDLNSTVAELVNDIPSPSRNSFTVCGTCPKGIL